MSNGSVPRLSDSFSRHFGFYQHHAEGCQVNQSILGSIGYIDLSEDSSNQDVFHERTIGGPGGVRQTALSFNQVVALMVLQNLGHYDRLRANVIGPRNRGFMLGADGRLYEVRMDIWQPRGIDTETQLDANTLDEGTWLEGSRIFYNTAPRPQDDVPVELSMSIAHEICEGIRSDHAVGGVFPRLVA